MGILPMSSGAMLTLAQACSYCRLKHLHKRVNMAPGGDIGTEQEEGTDT